MSLETIGSPQIGRIAAILALLLAGGAFGGARPLLADDQAGENLAAENQAAGDLTGLPAGRPVKVEVSVELLEVSQIQDHEEKFDVEFFLYLVWRDPRLAFNAEQEGRDKRIVSIDKIWTPQPQLMDDLDVNVQTSGTAHVYPDGTVRCRQYYRGTVSSNFDLHEFPFDRHVLEVNIEASAGEVDEIVYVAGESALRGEARHVPHGWKLLGTSSNVIGMRYPRLNETYSRHVFSIEVRRDPHYYWCAIVLPLLPIVFTSWAVFWMDPKEFSSQVGVGITAMLTVVAYRITIDSSLPPLTYMTRMDYFLLICQGFVFTAFLMSVVVHVCYSLGAAEMVALADRINVRCRWLPPPLMLATCVLLLFLKPDVAMTIVAAALALILLWCRPTWGNLKRWVSAAVYPERLVDQQPVRIQECLLKGPSRSSTRVG
ncbi:MAG TPA: hypothetical protein VN699_02530 [Pirellulales bacterium]|nr:hypothetical protein [Pirellulales bacterium]